jgi:multiple sugar transport system substrate-binding protein
MSEYNLTRRAALVAAAAGAVCKPWVARAAAHEVVHWSWLSASDGEVWQKMIDGFNSANKDVQIRMELVPEEQYTTKVLAAAGDRQGAGFRLGHGGSAGEDGQRRSRHPAR